MTFLKIGEPNVFFSIQKLNYYYRKRAVVPRISSLAISILIYSLSVAVAADPFHDAIALERPDVKILYLSSDVAIALEIAKLEAQKQKIAPDQIGHLAVFFYADTFLVSLGPPYGGGLDGPEFRVEIRRSDFKVVSVVNKLIAK